MTQDEAIDRLNIVNELFQSTTYILSELEAFILQTEKSKLEDIIIYGR